MSPQTTFSLQEVSELLHVAPQRLRQWEESFPLAFGNGALQARTHYSQTDLATLLVIQRFLENGFSAEQISQHLNGQSSTQDVGSATSALHSAPPAANSAAQSQTSPQLTNSTTRSTVQSHEVSFADAQLSNASPTAEGAESNDTASYLPEPYAATAVQPFGDMLGEMLGTVANSQQSMLNVQDSIREMLGVIVQDNFNLKSENRKLRDRMLELERALAEYQRREETRKERLEGRLRAVEGTLSAMQQQLAQLVQLQRQKAKRTRFW
ncbi:MAG: MerR family transcriptional regulator [Caldilineaceae bacterium]